MARLAMSSEPVKLRRFLLSTTVFIIVLANFHFTSAGPTGQRSTPQCVSFCQGSKNFLYETGTTYVYDYETDIETSVIVGSQQRSHVRVTARAEVDALSSCDLKLQLKNVHFQDLTGDHSQEYEPRENLFKEQETELEKHALLFGFQDGKVEQICANPEEDVWVLNVKRGIISMLQNSVEDLSASGFVNEVDINGKCPTEYVLDGSETWGGGVTYKKLKDLTKCTSRQTQLSAIQSVPYSSSSPIQNIPLLSGSLECSQTVRNKRIEKSVCLEQQRFQPFEQRNSGAVTTVTQNLAYVSEHPAQRYTDENTLVKKSLLFEEEEPLDGREDNAREILQLIDELEMASFPQVTKAAPQLFSDFVEGLRRSNEASIRSIFQQVSGISKEKHFMEALPMIGTASSLAFLADLTLQNALEEDQVKSWETSLAFIKHPTVQMVKAVAPLLQQNEPSMEALLGISSLINSYCRYHPTCNQDIAVNEILETITSYLSDGCRLDEVTPENVRQMVLRLKAIGNAGVVPMAQEVTKTPVIMMCLADKTNPVEIRLAAIDSLRRLPCSAFNTQGVIDVFTNTNENTEVRIKAFLSLMKCANRHTIELIKSVLYTETVNQVASFVWTYLTNLQETNRPEKQEIRDLLSNEFLQNKFNTDARKFSRNFEASSYWEDWNVGGGLDSNIIFTEESFLPKAGMINLTMQLFGESVNVFEFGVRTHGLEDMLEKVFGPQGYLPDTRVTEFLGNSRKKRDATSDTDGLGYLYDQSKGEDDKAPGGSFYTRMFGNEILYKHFEVSDETQIPNIVDETGKSWFNIRNVLDNLSTGKKTEFSKSMVILDSSYSVTTSSGFPLNLGVRATATTAMIAKGKFNVGRFLETKEMDIHGTLIPSTTVIVDGTLAVKIGRDQLNLKTGLKLHNTLRSSTAVEVNLLIKGKTVLHASVNVPQDRHEIIDVSSELMVVGPNGQALVDDKTSTEDSSLAYITSGCSSKYTSELVGMKLCLDMRIPHKISFTPIRPTFFKVYLEKVDDFPGYTFDYRFESDTASTKLSAVFDTPGSTIDRKIAADFLLDQGMGKIAASLESVSTSIRGEGIYTQFQKHLELSLASHDKTSFLLSTGIRSDGNVMKPHFLITWYSRPVVDMKGTIDLTPQANNEDKIAIEMNLKHLTETPVKVVGEIIGSGEMKQASLSIESYMLTGNIRSHLKRKPGHWSTKTSMEYSWKRERLHTAELSAKMQRSRQGTLSKTLVTAGFSSTQFPDNSVDFHWETQTSFGFCENRLKTGWGKTTWEGHTLFSRQNQVDHSELRFETSLMCSRYDIDYRLEFSHRANTEGFNTKILGRLGAENEFNANMDYLSAMDDLLRKSLEAGATWPNTEYTFKASFFEKQRNEFEAEVSVHLNKTRDLKATALYMNRSNNLKLDHNIEFRARGFTSVPLSGSIGFSATEKQSHIGLQVQFEGRKPYSSRMSTSLDYSHSKFSHKLEGKLTINDKKYNGELLYVTTREGARNVTLDLQLENRIFVQATLKGMLPSPMFGTILVIPDKDGDASSKVELEGILDPHSVILTANYFGEAMSFAGRYDDSSVFLDMILPEHKKYMLSVAVPKFGFQEAQMELEIVTPFEGYQNVSFSVNHNCDGENMKTTLRGGAEKTLGDFVLSGVLAPKELSISTDFNVTGYPKYQASLLVLRKAKRKSFQISFKADEKESLFDVDFIRLEEGYLGKLDFYGCSFLPKISTELTYQFSASRAASYRARIQWATNASNQQQIFMRVKHQSDPFSIDGTLTTPWDLAKHIDLSIDWDPRGANRKFLISSKETPDVAKAVLQLTVSGNMQDFRHELDGQWYAKSMRVTVSGGLNGFADSNLHTILRLPENHISLDLLSKRGSDKYIGEFKTDLNNAVTTGGIKWDFSSEVNSEKVASIWGQAPKYPPVSATFAYGVAGNKRTIKMKVAKDNADVIDLMTLVQITGLRHWDTDIVLQSKLQAIPSISLTSKHNLIDLKKMRHATNLRVVPLNEQEFWLDQYIATFRHFSTDISVDNLEDIKGTAIIGDTDFSVDGKIEKVQSGYTANVKVSSNAFHQVNLQGSFVNQGEIISTTARVSSKDDETIVKGQVDVTRSETEQTGRFSVESKFTPKFEGLAGLKSEQGVELTAYLLKDTLNMVTFNAKSQVAPSVGNVYAKLTSGYFTSISHLQADLDYKLAGTDINCAAVFQDNENVHSVNLETIWGEDSKGVKLSYSGPITSLSVEAMLEGMRQLVAYTTYNGQRLGEISITYRPEQGDFSYGKHGVYLSYTNRASNTQNFNVIVGLDSKKIYTNVQTPFVNWTDVVVDGQMFSTATSKGIKFLLQRENESIKGSFESKNSRKTGTLQLAAELSVDGFSKLRQIILERAQATDIEGLSAVKAQNFTFQLNWASSNFNVKVETPVDVLKKIAFSGNWELKKPQKFITVTGQINDRNYDLKTDLEFEDKKLKGKLSFSSDDSYTVDVSYDFTESYETNLVIETPNQQWNLGGKVSIKDDAIDVELTTPIKNFESIAVSAHRVMKSASKGLYSLSWDVNGKSDKVELVFEIEQGRIELRGTTPIEPWSTVVVTIIYDTPFQHLTFHSQRGDGQEVKVNFEMASSGNITNLHSAASSKILVAIETPVKNYEDIKFSLLYDRKNFIHNANLSITKSAGTTEGTLNLMFQHNDPVALDISAHLASPTLTTKATAHASLLVDPNGESTVSAHVQANGKRYEMYGMYQFTNTITKLEMRTSLPFLRQLKFALIKADSVNLYGLWAGNSKQVEIHGDVFSAGLSKSKLSFNVSTPIDLMGSFGFEGEISSKDGNTNAMMVFQNHAVRWLAKLDRSQDVGKEDWRLQVNTPLAGYKHVIISLKHVLNSIERSIVSVVTFNKKNMSMKLNLQRKQFNMVLASQIAYLPIQATIDSKWESDIVLKIDTSTGNNEYGTTFKMNLQGISDGNLEFDISSMQHLGTSLDWRFDGDLSKGQGLVNIKNQMVGIQSLRSSWENQNNWQEFKSEFWLKTGSEENEKGATLEYKVTPHANHGKLEATAKYTVNEETNSIVFEGSLDETSSHLNFDSVLQTPFEDFQTFKTKGQLTMKNEIGFKIDSRVNDEKLIVGSLDLFVRPAKSGLAVTMDLPLVLSDPFELDASYDMTSEEKIITTSFKQNVYVIDLRFEVTIPKTGNMIDMKLSAESTVPSIPIDVSGSCRLEYAVSSDGTREMSFRLKGDEVGDWKLLTALKAMDDVHAKVIFEGPFWLMPTLMAELNVKGNLNEGVSSDVTVIMEGSEVTAALTLSQKEWQSSFTYNVGSNYRSGGRAHINFGDHSNIDITFTRGHDYNFHAIGNLNMKSDTKEGSGEVTITSGENTVIPLAFKVVVGDDGTFVVTGSSQEHNIKVAADLKGTNGMSWFQEGESKLKIDGNIFGKGDTTVELEASHFIRRNEYSLNVTTKSNLILETYLKTGRALAFFGRVKGYDRNNSDDDLRLDVTLLPSNANVHLSFPAWPVKMHLAVDYGTSVNSAFVNGVLHLNGEKSFVNASLSTGGNQSVCKAVLDIPSISQKIDISISTIMSGPQNMKATVNLKVNEQVINISGGLKSQVFDSTRGERYIERVLQVSTDFTTTELTTIGLELFVRKPLKSYSSLSVVSTLTVNDQVSTVSGGYELPNADSYSTGIFFKLQSSYLALDENYEFFLKSFGRGIRKVEGKLNYKFSRVDLLWDFVVPTSVISLSYSGKSDDEETLSFQLESVLNPAENVQFSINSQGWDTHYTFRTSLTRSAQTVIGHLFIDAPRLFSTVNEYKIVVTTNEDGSYAMEASAARGRLVMELVGDAAITSHNANIVLKAMGSYGSHYAMVVGNRNNNGGEYVFEITAESSSLLVGKRVNIRGNVTVDEKGIRTVLQCRARRNIHELSMAWARAENGGGKFTVDMESPSLDPVKVEADWSSLEKNYHGKLSIVCFNEAHEAEFGINLQDFEGKLHIVSSLLPSKEFNFHVKSIVNSRNIDLLGDIRIRGAHWRLEGIASFGNLRDMTFKVEARTPFAFMDRVTFGIKSVKDEVYLEIHTPAAHLPNIMFQLGGMQALDKGLWHELKPNLIISLPNEKYSAMASLETPRYTAPGIFHLLFQYTGKDTHTVEAYAEISSLKTFKLQMENPGHIELRLVTPFDIFHKVRLNIEGEINMKRAGKMQVVGAFNAYEGKFDASFDNSNGNMQAATRLVTNVPKYEKSAFAIAIETFQGIGDGKSFHVEFRKPDWENMFRLDADYHYNFESLMDLEGEVNVNMDSYMNLPPLHGHLKSGMKNNRYSGVIEGTFGLHKPTLKVETENLERRFTLFIEGKAGEQDKYNLVNTFELIPLQENFSFREKLDYKGGNILDMEVSLSDDDQVCEGRLHLNTPWGPIHSKAALTPITFLTMNEALSFSQLMKNSNVTLDVTFNEEKLIGLELVSRDGMRLFEIHNPIRPVSLSVAVQKVDWNSLRLKAGVCWDLKVPERSSLGIEAYAYKRSTGITLGGYLAGARHGILTVKFEHFLISSKLAQNLKIRWNGHGGRTGDIGYTLNIIDKSTGFKKQFEYGLTLIAPTRHIIISGSSSSSEDKYSIRHLSVAWDAFRDPHKVLSFNVSTQKKTTWRTTTLSQTLEIQHFSWEEPVALSVERTLVHDHLKQIDVTVKPSSNPSSHLTLSGMWDNGDWENFVTSVVQPSTKINIEAKYNFTETNKFFAVTYMLYTGESKIFSINFDRDGTAQQIQVQAGDVAQPKTISSLTTQSTMNEHSLKANIYNYQVIGHARTNMPYLDVTIRHENANKIQLMCGLPHPKEIVLKVSRSHFMQTVNDVSFLVRLNSSNLLSTRLHWRPEIMDDLVEYDWLKGSKILMYNVLPSFPEIHTAIRSEFEGHWNLFSMPVKDFLVPLYEISTAEINSILEDLQVVGHKLQQLYRRNDFYIKDIMEILYDSFSPLGTLVVNVADYVREGCKTFCYYLMNAGKIMSNAIIKYYGRLEVHVMRSWEYLERLVVQFWNDNSDWIQGISAEVEEFVDALIEALEGRIELLEEKLMAVGFIRKILQLYRDYVTWLDELPIDDYLSAIEDFFQIKIWDRLEELFGPYLEAVRNALDAEYIKELLETPPIPYIRFALRQTKNAFVRVWEVIELEEKVKDLVRHVLKNADDLMQRNFPSWELNWDFDKGFVDYDQYLSLVEWTDFTQSPRWRLQGQDKEEVNQIANMYYQVLDYLENLKPIFDLRIRDILPPFGGLAMMAGDYHYYTFDKKYFRFAGECSYVLVADLLHNGFSFIVNYETRDGAIRKKSYSIALTDHNIEFDVVNFKVTVDGKKVELPTKVDTVYIRRQETRLDIYDVRGYQIRCTLSQSVCTFSTSGWYYGKLAGLLGTYDNEHVNDFRSPDGQIITDIPSFAYSWRVGKNRNQCRMKNFAKDEMEPTDVDDICYNLLANRASPLRPCFNTVDTTIFMEMCKYDVSRNVNSANRAESACTSMSAYVTECQKHNIDVWMPPTCIRCKLEDGTALTTGENATLQTDNEQPPPSSADIVILLEEKDCMDQIDISNAVLKLEAAFRAEGIVDNRYALVGFGGQGIHHEAHIQTSSAGVWLHSTLFKVPDKVNVTGTRKSDLYGAINFASRMTYRAGVSKNLIAITCGDEKCGDSVRYADTLTLLVENDIKLHMLTPMPFTLKGKKKQDDHNKVIGYDVNGVYTVQHAKRGPLVADPSFKRQLNYPKDLCTPLAVETNGTRFSTDSLTKKTLDVWSRRVAQTAHPSECQRCECVPDKNGGSRLMCHQCVSPSLWKFMEEWNNYQSQELDDMFALDILETETLLFQPN